MCRFANQNLIQRAHNKGRWNLLKASLSELSYVNNNTNNKFIPWGFVCVNLKCWFRILLKETVTKLSSREWYFVYIYVHVHRGISLWTCTYIYIYINLSLWMQIIYINCIVISLSEYRVLKYFKTWGSHLNSKKLHIFLFSLLNYQL